MDAAGFEHDVQHANANDAIAALQLKVGINNSSDTNSMDYKMNRMTTLMLQPDATVKFAVSDGQVLLVIWDVTLQRFCPLLLDNGVLGVGAPIT